ncbi:helix-turn-helix domain-containing protein [Legionella hackeliae]|uniref:Putative DNA-binding transcriptional regulator n=1 Tax=Legionella hackeliae TaxID=449 RepID=A0A0A8UZ53_LEGHA|nr:XRE family transcriptional regulator [Legionella hackeliae]KTD12623.1 DNA-binding transcriptional regulator [Legionella hackeliae]CEK12039.1 putative DNA-binding transcriptional regulator [Legionella hackeliae]STX48825.1 DNA-binding transcriptional regulator [Legionella hackeliae]
MQSMSGHIAKTLKALRQQRGWSLDKTAQKTGVSKAMLGQIEREESSPTVAILWKIATGFQVSFSTFLAESTLNSETLIDRSASQLNPQSNEEQIRINALFPFDEQLGFEMFVIELLPGCEQLSSPHEPGVIEHVIVIGGDMEVLINQVWHCLRCGEGLRFDAHQPHGYRNKGSMSAFFHNIIHYP